MPTSDDISISLTVKDGSNLDKLRQNLDAILKTGPGGTGVVGVGGGKELKKALEDKFKEITLGLENVTVGIDFLKTYITPTKMGKSLNALASEAATFIKLIKDFDIDKEIADIMSGKKGSLESIVKAGKLEDVSEVGDFLKETVEDLVQDLGEITERGKPLGKAKQYIRLMREIFSNLDAESGLGRTLLTKYLKIREEEKERLAKFLEKTMGGKQYFYQEFPLARLKEETFKEEKREEVEKALKEKMDKIDPDIMGKMRAWITKIPDLEALEEVFAKLGYEEFTADLFRKGFIQNTPELKALAYRWLELLLKEGWDPDKITGAMGGYISFINKEFGEALFKTSKRLDFLLFEKTEKAFELLGIPKTEHRITPLEPKGGGAGELEKEKNFYYPILNREINILTSRINENFVDSKKIIVSILKRAEMLEEMGMKWEFHVKELEKLQQEAQKQTVAEGGTEKILTKIQELSKALDEIGVGINSKLPKDIERKLIDALGAQYSKLIGDDL